MLFAITMGDSSGVGPEILLKAFREGRLSERVIVFGDMTVLDYCNRQLGYGVALRRIATLDEWRDGCLNILDANLLSASDIRPGQLSASSGAAAREYVIRATRAAIAGEVAALVTLPMNKEATKLSDPSFVGHTELIGGLCGARDVTMMLVSEQLIVTHVSTHVSLRQAIERVKRDRVARVIELTCEAVSRLRANPRVAVAGLNPHAGEHGLFGNEDMDEIRPAVEWATAQGMPVEGPIPPDSVFYLAVRRKRFDAIVCMYHDQGHVPLKLLDFEAGVNVSLGLPIIRTSVDHGTAFDIAYQGKASTFSLEHALRLAARLAKGRPAWA